MPQIEVIKEALNRQTQEIKALYSSKPNVKTVDLFCVGMGFKRPIHTWEEIDLANKGEVPTGKVVKSVETSVVCDILALTEIIPTKAELQEVEEWINTKWSNYWTTMLQKVNFRESLYDDFVFYLRESLQTTALTRLNNGIRGKLLRALIDRTYLPDSQWLDRHTRMLKRWKFEREKQIEILSLNESLFYTEKIRQVAERIFQNNAKEYENYVRATLDEFVQQQSGRILELLTLEFPSILVFETFDEEKAFGLAKQIYDYLDEDIRPKIGETWLSDRERLDIISRAIGGSLDNRKVKSLTEEAIRKVVWDKLRSIVKTLVIDIFREAFKKKAKERFYEWIDLSSSREVIRPIKDVVNILPDALEYEIYSNEFMFGATPIHNALKKVSLRFTDKKYIKHQKTLVVISDGEFSEHTIPDVADLLQKSGVTIVSLYISNKNIASKLVEKAGRNWPPGARMMFEMSSTSKREDGISHALGKSEYRIKTGKRLFIQINHSEALEDILDALLINE